jgi:hypothetical protein
MYDYNEHAREQYPCHAKPCEVCGELSDQPLCTPCYLALPENSPAGVAARGDDLLWAMADQPWISILQDAIREDQR